MVDEIRVYIEGGGDGKETKARLRQGFHVFLNSLVETARSKRVGFQLVASGSRNEAFDDFQMALETHPDAFNVLLVDSEAPVNAEPRQHLQQRDGWDLSHCNNNHCHLMVQTMEAWLIADLDALIRFYGQGFRANALPNNPNVEQVDKEQLAAALKAATVRTSKGKYHKTRHAPKILEQLDAVKVRRAASHCDRLFVTLDQLMRADQSSYEHD
jgi:hypothetical protein